MNNLTRSLAMFMAIAFAGLTGNGQSCIDPDACNYDLDAGIPDAVCLELESYATHTSGELAGMTTWRLYVHSAHPDDFVTAVFGNANEPLSLTTTTSFYQNALGGATAEAINPMLLELGIDPDLEFDSYVTIGLTQQADASAGENGVSTAASPDQNWLSAFDPGGGAPGGDLVINDLVGGLWFIFNGDTNGAPDEDGRILLAQLTTSGDIGGTVNIQYFPAGGDASTATLSLDTPCDFGSIDDCDYPEAYEDCEGNCINDADEDLVCDEVDDCVGAYDALGVCNGNCEADADGDGICDDDDDCIGTLDACGICNGPGAVYDCGCSGIPDGDCDCDGNQVDVLGDCGGGCTADADADGICDDTDDCVGSLDAIGVCNGDCAEDVDSDGICDDEDDCVGQLDACGVCNGNGPSGDCGCDDIPAGDCDCDGNQLDAIGVCGGTCTEDADGDDVCDDVDDCIGQLDACGVCNGQGAVYECGCADTPAGDCDCDGNQLDDCGVCGGPGSILDCGCSAIPDGDCDCDGNQADAIGVCGGSCTADADGDGLCDDVDDCIGSLDACGICNGLGAIYDCGCNDIPDGDCDCGGIQVDALGVCGGDCVSDDNDNGICDLYEGSGCADEEACNFDPLAEPVDDTEEDDYCLITEVVADHTEGDLAGFTTYRVSIQTLHPTDFITSVSGNSNLPTYVQTTTSFYQNMFGATTPANLNPILVSSFPDMAYDSWITIGLDGPADLSAGETNVSLVESPGQGWSMLFDPGNGLPGSDIIIDDLVGGVWYILNGDVNGIPDENGRVLLGQFTTDGELSGNMQVQVFPQGDNINYILVDLPLGMGVGCTTVGGDDTCLYDDAVGDCGGDCAADVDSDGICDDEDDCIGVVDACGVCNGAGDIYDCGCSDIPAGDCDCDGNQLDALGVCGGACSADADSDGICDDEDDCIGAIDECGICNGPGASGECGCDEIPDGACDCEGNALDAIGDCGGDCAADDDSDGICDDEDDCIGSLDACGICNGPGAIYDCGCGDTPDGDCDCDGNQLDAFGECGGDCTADVNENGICDDAEPQTCDDQDACNYDPNALPFVPTPADEGYCAELRVIAEHNSGELAGMTTYQVLIHTENHTDFVSSVYGNAIDPLEVTTSTAFFQHVLGGVTPESVNPILLDTYPNLAYDSWVTIGLDGPADSDAGESATSTVQSPAQLWVVDFEPGSGAGGGSIIMNDAVGGVWYILNGDSNGLPGAEGTVLLGQFTTDGDLSGTVNVQIFPEGDNINFITVSLPIGGNCVEQTENPSCIYPESDIVDCDGNCVSDADGDEVCDADEVPGCTDNGACNYNAEATDDDGSCLESDECGVCGGPGAVYDCGCSGIPAGDCDCDGNQLDIVGDCGGDCTTDADGDGVCDDEDDCVGAYDECGICNGPGASGECGCEDIPNGDCDCEGNQLDALGVCGGDCAADADSDGICDDDDDCIGSYDACDVCNGPGAIYDCGCADIPDGDCDCDGNQLDVIGECGGDCTADVNENGICDDVEPQTCDDPGACNYDPNALPFVPTPVDEGYCAELRLIEEHNSGELAGMTTYQVLLHTENQTDFVSSVYGNSNDPLDVTTSTSFFQHALGGLTPESVNPILLFTYPNLAYDSWVTIGLDGPANSNAGESGASTVQSPAQLWVTDFEPGFGAAGGDIVMNDAVGGVWYILNGDSNGLPKADGTVLLGQFTTDGELSGTVNVQIFPEGDNVNFITVSLPIGGDCVEQTVNPTCTYPDSDLVDCDGNCIDDADGDDVCDADEVPGCTDEDACNYNSDATDEDGSCLQFDSCEVCGGTGIPDGDCDCDGNQLDAVGICAGSCLADVDADGICDDVDDCVGAYDSCGECNGPGPIFECGCSDIPDGDCDCDGNQLDVIGVCGGDCIVDADTDGICDDVDDCVGAYDSCGQCNGPGAIYACGCSDILAGDCDCDGNQLDAVGVCGGDCVADVDSDGICDDVDDCVGAYDDCGQCNGPGAIYECGCSDIPEADCDCDGNQLDAIGVCGGDCPGDIDGDGICDTDEIPGCTDEAACNFNPEATDEDGTCAEEDECGVCGGNGIAAGDCDCDGNQLDALGVCGGTCPTDLNGDGICDTDNILGCTYPEACNFDEEANVNDGSCDFLSCAGCTDEDALNYDGDATVEDGSCLYGGCTAPAAENYDGSADLDDGSCQFPGCPDPLSCNYDAEANTDDGSCEYDSCSGCSIDLACNYDPEATLLDESCDFYSCRGCTNPDADNYDSEATQDDGSCIYLGCTDPDAPNFDPNATFDNGSCLIGGCKNTLACNYDYYADYDDGSCEFESCAGCMVLFACNYDPDATVTDNSSCDFYGCCGDPDALNYTPGTAPEAIYGCDYGTAGQPSVMTGCDLIIACNFGDPINPCEFDSCAGCGDPEACNYDASATLPTTCLDAEDVYGVDFVDCDGECIADSDGDGVCDVLEVSGCTDGMACNFDALATQDDGSCETTSCGGCLDASACNYDVGATLSDESCEYLACAGCLIVEACNYNPDATVSANNCTYPVSVLLDCAGDCINDADGDGICDEQEVEGCTDMDACNYQSLATEDNGSCDFNSCKGCTVPEACNYDPQATLSDGSCEFSSCLGCTYVDALNYDPDATEDSGICLFDTVSSDDCPGDLTQDGVVGIADLLEFLVVFDSSCAD